MFCFKVENLNSKKMSRNLAKEYGVFLNGKDVETPPSTMVE